MANQSSKPKGWHSRRHETREAQDEAREAHRTRASRRPKQRWDPDTKQWIKEVNDGNQAQSR